MMRFGVVLAAGVAAMAMMAGCGEGGGFSSGKGDFVSFTVNQAPQVEIPQRIKHLAVQQFSGRGNDDGRWGDVASDKLMGELQKANQTFNRYDLVDRHHLKSILAEKDMQIAFGDPDAATKHAGELKAVDAIIYGTVKASAQEREATKQVPDFGGGGLRMKTEYYTKLYCTAIVSFTMVDVTHGGTLDTFSTTEVYDSDKEKKGLLASFTGGGGLKPTDQCLDMLVSQAVAKFVARISPSQVTVEEPLASGKSSVVKTGNKLAAEKDYDGALECYLKAIEEKPDDSGALFNAGLMYEEKGDFKKAVDCYNKAFGVKDDPRYLHARSRAKAAMVEKSN